MKKTTALFAAGWAFYAIAELAPLMDSVALFPIYFQKLNPGDSVPFGWFGYMTDFDKPLFMFAAVPALGLLFLSFSYLRMTPFKSAALHFLATWSIILAIPDMVWPFGTIYYETLKYYFGVFSLLLGFATVLFYVFCRFEMNEKS